MDRKILETYQQRVNEFLLSRNDDLVYRDYIQLDVSLSVTDEVIPYDRRLDLEYKKVKEGEVWGYDWASGWFHMSAEVPESFAGKELCLRIHTGSEILVFDEHGEPLYGLTGYSCFDELYCKERYVIGKDFRPGEKLDFWLQSAAHGLFGCALPRPYDLETPVLTTGGGSRLLKHMRLCVFDRELWSLLLDMRVLNGIVKSYGLDDFRARRILKLLNDAIDIVNYRWENASAARAMLAEKAFTATASPAAPVAWSIGHGHLDIGWLWPVSVTNGKSVRTFTNQISLLQKYPEYIFGASQAYLYKTVKEQAPGLYEKVRAAVASGRWEIQGGMYVEADCNLASGESLVRQFLHGKNFFRDEFGVKPETCWIPDVFGYSGNLPQISRLAGCPYFLTQKLSWNNYNQFPHHTFHWVGVDGSSLLTHFPPENTYNAFGIPEQRIPAMNRFHEAGISDAFVCLYGIGDGGGGPSEDFVENNLRQKSLDGCPRVVFGRADDYFHRLEKIAGQLPEWRGELYFECHRGTLTSQARTKRGNRLAEQALTALEILCSALPKAEYPAEKFDKLWKMVLLNQFHDILPGSSIHKVYEVAEADYRYILGECAAMARQTAEKLFTADDDAVVMVNTLSVPYCGSTVLPERFAATGAVDENGNILPCQIENGQVIVRAELPADSVVTWRAGNTPAAAAQQSDSLVMENTLIRYTFAADGRLISAFDKEFDREILTAPANVLSFYHDRPIANEAWDIDIYYRHDFCGNWQGSTDGKMLSGPVRSTLEFVYNTGKSSMKQQVVLRADSKQLDFVTHVEWHEERTMLRTGFPVDVQSGEAAFDIQYAFIKRTTNENNIYDRAQFEACGQRYADLSDGEKGVALLNDCKYGYHIKGNVIDLALLRSPRFPDAKADIGSHDFTYSFLPHGGMLNESNVKASSAMLNRAPYCFDRLSAGGAGLPCRQISGKNISLEVVKKAEKSDALVIRVVETAGCHSSGEILWQNGINDVYSCDLLEWEIGEKQPLDGNIQQISLKPFEIRTFMVK